MADRAVTPTALVLNAESDDIKDADGVSISTAATDQWVVAADGRSGARLLLKFLVDSDGDTIVITAGDRPPSPLAGLGDLSLVLVASEVRYIIIEAARFMQNDGTIIITCSDDGSTCYAFEYASETPHELNP